jgi:hypothetical protein
MKLRSGKILTTFPSKLNNELETRLQNFKIVFTDNPKHAKELLDVISEVWNWDFRFAIRDKLAEITDPQDRNTIIKRNIEEGAAGELACLLVGNPQYHDIIEKRIKDYALEAPLLGSIEENNIEME